MNFRQTNAFAMQHGVVLGLAAVGSMACSLAGLTWPPLSSLGSLIALASPVLAWWLTRRMACVSVADGTDFGFGAAWAHTFLMGMYASLWLALAVFLYMAFLDQGYIFAAYERALSTPEAQQMLQQTGPGLAQCEEATGMRGASAVVEVMRRISPANYASMVIYLNIMACPVISALIALVARRKAGPFVSQTPHSL